MEILKALFYIGVFIIGVYIAIVAAFEMHSYITGTPLARRVFNEILKEKDNTIQALKELEKSLREQIRLKDKRIKEQSSKIHELEKKLP